MKSKRIDDIQRKYEDELFSKPDYREQQRAEKRNNKEMVTLKEWLKRKWVLIVCLIVVPIGILALLDGIGGGTPDRVRAGFIAFISLIYFVAMPLLMLKLIAFALKKEGKANLMSKRINSLSDLLEMSEKKNNTDRHDKSNALMNEIIRLADEKRTDHDDIDH